MAHLPAAQPAAARGPGAMNADPAALEPLPREAVARLERVTTATISMQLLKRGIRRVWMQGPRPLTADTPRISGEAFTLRFIPMREDISTLESYQAPGSLREAMEAMPAGRLVVIDARGERGCGTLGDILVARLKVRGAKGVVSDGAMRDVTDIEAVGLPVYCSGPTAPPSITGLYFAGWDVPIGCGGIAVLPGDVVVADADGAVVVPRALADEVGRDAVEQERFERYAQMRVRAGAPVLGLYPPNEQTLADYEAWRAAGEPDESEA